MAYSAAGQLWRGASNALAARVSRLLRENHQNPALTAHTDLATASSLSNKSASTMEISSMTSRWQFSQPCRTPGRWARATHWARGARPEPMPVSDIIQPGMRSSPVSTLPSPSCLPTGLLAPSSSPRGSHLPAKAWRVVPPMWQAATPVLAVATVPVGGSEPRIRFSR